MSNSRKLRNSIFVLFVAGLVLYLFWGKGMPGVATMSPEQLTQVDGWKLDDLEGNEFDSEILNGNVVLVHFWATWCKSCTDEIATLNRLMEKYDDVGFKVVGVLLDLRDEGRIENYVEYKDIEYPVLVGDAQIVKTFGNVKDVPTSFLVGRDGKVLKFYPDVFDAAELEAEVMKALQN